MVVNFSIRKISRGTRKLTRISILIIIKKKTHSHVMKHFFISLEFLLHPSMETGKNKTQRLVFCSFSRKKKKKKKKDTHGHT
jgi:hypothetical protein